MADVKAIEAQLAALMEERKRRDAALPSATPTPAEAPSTGGASDIEAQLDALMRAKGVEPPTPTPAVAEEGDELNPVLDTARYGLRGRVLGTAAGMELPEVLSKGKSWLQDAVEKYTGWRPEVGFDDPVKQSVWAMMSTSPYAAGIGGKTNEQGERFPALNQGADWLRENVADRIAPEPTNARQRMSQTAGEWSAGTGPLSKGETVGKGLVKRMAPSTLETGAIVGASTGKELMRQVFGEDWESGGELGGAVSGALLTAAGMMLNSGRSFKDAEHILKTIAQYADDPEAAAANLTQAIKDGRQGSLGQLTGDQGLYNAEEVIKRANRKEYKRIVKSREDGANALSSTIQGGRTLYGIHPPSAKELSEKGTTRLKQTMQRLIDEKARREGKQASILTQTQDTLENKRTAMEGQEQLARQGTEESALPFETAGRVDETGAELGQDLSTLYKETKKAEINPLYDDIIMLSDDVDPKDYRPDLEKIMADRRMGKTDLSDLHTEYPKFKRILEDDDMLTPSEITHIMSDIKSKIAENADIGKRGPVHQLAGRLLKSLEETSLHRLQGYEEVTEMAADFYKKFHGDKLLKAMNSKNPEEVVKQAGGWRGDSGAAFGRMITDLGDANVTEKAAKTLRSALAQRASSATTAKQLDVLEKAHAGALEHFPEVARQLTALKNTRARLELAQAELKEFVGPKGETGQLKKQLADAQKQHDNALERLNKRETKLKNTLEKPLHDFLDQPRKEFTRLLNQPDSLKSRKDLASLQKFAERSGAGEAFTRQMRLALDDMLRNEVTAVDKATGSASRYSANTQEKFNRMKLALKQSGAFSSKEIAEIETALKQGIDNEALQTLSGEILRDANEDSLRNMLASAYAATLSPLLGSKQSLMINGAIRRTFKSMMKENERHPERLRMMADYMSDPKKFEADLVAALEKEGREFTPKTLPRLMKATFGPLRGALRATAQIQDN